MRGWCENEITKMMAISACVRVMEPSMLCINRAIGSQHQPSTTSAIGLRGHTRCHTRSRIEFDAAGLRTLEVLAADGSVRLRARRAA